MPGLDIGSTHITIAMVEGGMPRLLRAGRDNDRLDLPSHGGVPLKRALEQGEHFDGKAPEDVLAAHVKQAADTASPRAEGEPWMVSIPYGFGKDAAARLRAACGEAGLGAVWLIREHDAVDMAVPALSGSGRAARLFVHLGFGGMELVLAGRGGDSHLWSWRNGWLGGHEIALKLAPRPDGNALDTLKSVPEDELAALEPAVMAEFAAAVERLAKLPALPRPGDLTVVAEGCLAGLLPWEPPLRRLLGDDIEVRRPVPDAVAFGLAMLAAEKRAAPADGHMPKPKSSETTRTYYSRKETPPARPAPPPADAAPVRRSRASRPMYSLEFLDDDGAGFEPVKMRGFPFVIGRKAGDITLDFDAQLSPRHVEFAMTDAGLLMRDLDSAGGTFVRLRAGERLALADGDEFVVGDSRCRFRLVDGGRARLDMPGPDGIGFTRALAGDRETIGWDGAASVVLPRDAFMSRLHAELTRTDAGWLLADAGSLNGVWVRVRGARPLDAGDMIRIGAEIIRINRA